MTVFRFVHCSDLHIDSPFRGFSKMRSGWWDRLKDATLKSFSRVVDLAIEEKVDAVAIAGDIFDGADKSLRAQLKFHRELKRLAAAGIPAFLAHGNHDPLDSWLETIQWPKGVHVFSGKAVERLPVQRDGKTLAHIHGISFPRQKVMDNLARQFSRHAGEGFAVGVLHTNVGEDPNHASYAPCSVDDLVQADMDYWALGHIHAHRVIREDRPAIVYCGNSQGRHVRETGAKGCCLVTLREGASPDIQFHATDVLRFGECEVDLTDCATLDQVEAVIRETGSALLRESEGRDLFLRMNLVGRTALHAELQKPGALDELQEEVLDLFENESPALWAELIDQTRGALDLETLRQGNHFIADVLHQYDSMTGKAEEVREWLNPLYGQWRNRRLLDSLSDEELQQLMEQARELTLEALTEEKS